MTLLNKALCCVTCFLTLLIWSAPPSVGGAFISEDLTPTEFLAQLESNGVVKEGVYHSGDFVLALASKLARTAKASSSQGAIAKAKLEAKKYMLQDAIEREELQFDGVKDVSERLNAKLISISQKSVAGELDGAYVLRTRVIDTNAEGKELLEVVMVCPIDGISVNYSKPVDVSARLQQDFKANILSSPSEQLLAFELFTDEERIQMLQMLADYLTGGKNNGTWATLMHDFSGSTAESLVHTEQFEHGEKLNELFATLNENPNHPAACLDIAKKMVELGFSQVSALFAARGTYSYVDIMHEEECRKIAEGTWAEQLLYPVEKSEATKQVPQVLASAWTQEYPRIRVLLAYNGKIDPVNLKTNFVLDDEFQTEMIEWGKESLLMKTVDHAAELIIEMSKLYDEIKNDPLAFMAKKEEYRQQFEDVKINSLELIVVLKLCKSFLDAKGDGEEAVEENITNAINATESVLGMLSVMSPMVGGLDVPLNEYSMVHYAAKAYEQYPSPETRELLSKTIMYSGYPKIATLIE